MPGFVDRLKDRLKRELGLESIPTGSPHGEEDVLARCRIACMRSPPRLIHALYQAADADVATWRYLAPYSKRDRPDTTLVFCACSKEGWKIEAFHASDFVQFQVTDIPWPQAAFHPYPIEFQDS